MVSAWWLIVLVAAVPLTSSTQGAHIFNATLAEEGERAPEVSTDELKVILARRSALVLDAPELKVTAPNRPFFARQERTNSATAAAASQSELTTRRCSSWPSAQALRSTYSRMLKRAAG